MGHIDETQIPVFGQCIPWPPARCLADASGLFIPTCYLYSGGGNSMTDKGFQEDVKALLLALSQTPSQRRTNVMLSATLTPSVQSLAEVHTAACTPPLRWPNWCRRM